MRQFYTPPVSNPKFDNSLSIKESYKPRQSGLETLGEKPTQEEDEKDIVEKNESTGNLTSEEIEESISGITELPTELSHLIDVFITDLKQPKYLRPLTIVQLSYLFQGFYTKFDKFCFQYLSNNNTTTTSQIPITPSATSFFTARESLSTGLSGMFARSRSSSTASGTSMTRAPRRSSSLFSLESSSTGNITQMLSPEEIKTHLKTNELNNLKIEKYMILCESYIFNKLLEVGISVSSPIKQDLSSSSIDTLSSLPIVDKSQERVHHTHQELFNVSSLFRNTPEFGNFDKLLTEKLRCLSKLSLDGKINLDEFLGIPDSVDFSNESKNKKVSESLTKFTYYSTSPYEKVQILLNIHESMSYSKGMSNDEFLSMLIYYIIKFRPKKLFLNAEFIKLFRYKKKLIQEELYALTNLEAALLFIEGLTLVDFSDELQGELTTHEKKILECKVSDVITLPGSNGKNNLPTAIIDSPTPANRQNGNESTTSRTNSNEGFRNTFDGSLRNIISKIRLYTPPTVNNLKPLPLPRSSSQLSMDYDGGSPLRSLASPNNGSSGEEDNPHLGTLTPSRSSHGSLPNDWKKYKDSNFDDLTIQQLKEIFEVYQKMIE
ncbi:similar to Saccharomyces cerevisiae YPL070W MUK1 Cytoplasmic protein of unknown function containing a Vps9 domain [Maudiozyma barnettii]|uniref:VPS9 domain-containing protein n=1 Tax=Maudiozyma barnettii TaxID=61262 RepID=A0A8H2VI04_9SACH|nr:guanine nucleotide exchange factor MUK1 [Kazachstania barnettii]CAB4255811.1 similar to Saccharomyces cerevisiae YPL070W MUK1 Cytoplasmic protein of unknown function containing a Vps9 domain [Kazachstania barnettii]CAD1784372.1 similar to Saccharomyces cerevisiae YPL070W MUK1 Cytoplasmic protein of unknown function containing a Vps9 domain [Kazachstania barnettii]